MAVEKLRAVHYVNQFFGQIGGEEAADARFSVKDGPVGPGLLLQKALGDDVEIVATIICGDNYFTSHLAEAAKELLERVKPYRPDIFFAGPAFNAGRYGIACGQACKTVSENLDIPVFTGMYEENPGVELYRSNAVILKTPDSAKKMGDAVDGMVRLARNVLTKKNSHRFVDGFGLGTPEEDGYFPMMRVRNIYTEKSGGDRALDMLLNKIHGRPFETEQGYAEFEEIERPEPIKDIRKARIALVSDAGLVEKGNKAGLKGRASNVWTKFNLDEFMSPDKTPADFCISHNGYFHDQVLEDRNRMVPYEIMKSLEASGNVILHRDYYALTGNACVAKWCERIGQEIAEDLRQEKVDGVILTST